jgi:hypothetical protein
LKVFNKIQRGIDEPVHEPGKRLKEEHME